MSILLTTPPLNVFEHMALDETLVHFCAPTVVLRFYNWTDSPAVTFGYAQFVREVRQQINTPPFTGSICRRPTGGGIVYHKDDLTFSLIFSSSDKPTDIYKKLHESVHAALVLSGLSAQVFSKKLPASAYAPSQNHHANACFINPVENDLLLENGTKMLGGAIRRFGTSVLYQGSLQIPGARTYAPYKKAIIQAVRSFLEADLQITAAKPAWLKEARQLASFQYNTSQWTEKF